MPYEIRYTDSLNKGVIVVEDREIDSNSTSLRFPGKGVTNYGTVIAEDILHLLENFAFGNPPDSPVEGQLWYDTSPGVDQLKVYDGTIWVAASGIFKGATAPNVNSALEGDLWVDTDNQQLYLNSGAGWILVGPEFSKGLSTGPRAAQMAGTDNITYTVLILDVEQIPVVILSSSNFTPKSTIAGFPQIQTGVNLSARILPSGAMKFRGLAESSESLRIGNNNITATNFLRADEDTTANGMLKVKNNQGVQVGTNGQVSLQAEGNIAILRSNFSGTSLDLRVKQDTEYLTGIRIKSNPGAVPSIGINQLNPQAILDINGDVKISSTVYINDTTDTTVLNEGALQIAGGTSIAKNLQVGGNVTTAGALTIAGNFASNGADISGFDTVTANEFVGNVRGSVIGNLQGSASSATRLTSVTSFEMTGDVTSPVVLFDGSGSLSKTFTTAISNDFIANKAEEIVTLKTDQILINRPGTGLLRTTSGAISRLVPTLPVGFIGPTGGAVAPPGWLLCDGREIAKTDAFELWLVIQHRFKDTGLMINPSASHFGLPDFRGRAPFGLDNMGGISANRITDLGADILGNSGGRETTNVEKKHIPQHEHDLRSSGVNAKQFYAIRDADSDPLTDSPEVTPLGIETGVQAVTGIPTSGTVTDGGETGNNDYRTVGGEDLGSPLSVMNPYVAVNYIIWAGT
jgi:microcystin-dependent protein